MRGTKSAWPIVSLWLVAMFVAPTPVAKTRAEPPPAEKPESPDYDPTSSYEPREVRGWRVLVSARLLAADQAPLCSQTLELLDDHLYRVARVVPAAGLEKLREIPIWVELAHPRHPCACYHVSADWLREHQMNPEKARAVEIANARNFLDWTHDQPWMLLHELAHGYHERVLGYDHAAVRACHEAAAAAGIYEKVLRIQGREDRHYALSNAMEYFAEASEAYFGANDFYPFNRAELERHDPAAYKLVRELWGVDPPR